MKLGYVGSRDESTGKKSGTGRMVFKNGDVYEGAWLDDKRHGKGVYHFANGDVFECHFVSGVKHGEGSYLYAQGELCSGTWQNG